MRAGATQETATEPAEAVTLSAVGTPGAALGVTASETVVQTLVPREFLAATRNTYAVPFVKPVTVKEVEVETALATVDHTGVADETARWMT